ncbi:UxaA family hydrolase [uncultured Sphingomonas sp.]|uniref:UxaA family hydrolase n=1 Tax=uncultured Sphingomonas sp. TaxID=158754 RepID=UPI0025FDA401|nr:UxaA family hydrolase [uncultured Sphingomonas sp.]
MTVAAIVLSPADNVAVCCRTVEPGETIELAGRTLVIAERVALGHKIALAALAPGDKVVKYGMPIGSMTALVPAGGWVHMHNMKSDYIAAHLRDAVGESA